MDGELQQLAEGGMLQGDLDFGRKMWAHCESLTSGTVPFGSFPPVKSAMYYYGSLILSKGGGEHL